MRDLRYYGIGIVILAAGRSTRLGTAKQLLLYKGDTLLNNAIKTACEINEESTIVILPAGRLAKLLEKDIKARTRYNFQYKDGIASSIRCGVKCLNYGRLPIQRIILMTCDQPHVDAAHLAALIAKQEKTGAKIVASLYEGRKGIPALFHRKLFPELISLKGDTGAKHIIEKYEADTAVVPFPLGAIDIDTEEAYQALITATPGK